MKSEESNSKKYLELFLLLIITVGPFSPFIKILLYMFLVMMNLNTINALEKNRQMYLVIVLSMVIPMIADIRNVDSGTSYSLAGFAYLAPFFLSQMFIKFFDEEEFYEKLEKVLFFFSAVSLIGFIMILYAPSVIEHFPVIVFYGRKVKSIIIFGAIRDYSGVSFLRRNCGIAFEPGAFQFVPNLGFALMIKSKLKATQKSYWIKLITYALTVFSTYSTSGIAIFVILVAYDNIFNFNIKKTMVVIAITLFLSGIIYSSYQYQVDKYETGNFSDRFANTIYVISNYAHHVFGLGSTGYDKIYQTDKRIGSWDTFTNLYLRFGLLFTILFLYLNINLRKLSFPIMATVVITLMAESIVGPIIVMLYYYAFEINCKCKDELVRR